MFTAPLKVKFTIIVVVVDRVSGMRTVISHYRSNSMKVVGVVVMRW